MDCQTGANTANQLSRSTKPGPRRGNPQSPHNPRFWVQRQAMETQPQVDDAHGVSAAFEQKQRPVPVESGAIQARLPYAARRS